MGNDKNSALKVMPPEGINPKEWQAKVNAFLKRYGTVKNAAKYMELPPFTEVLDKIK